MEGLLSKLKSILMIKKNRVYLGGGIVLLIVAIIAIQMVWDNYREVTLSGTIEATKIRLGSERGGRVNEVAVKEGEKIRKSQVLVEVHPAAGNTTTNEFVRSPIDGIVLDRIIEPGEFASPGSPVLVVSNLDDLTLTIYVQEDRYGKFALGQTYTVTVDSFPNEKFSGVVSHIADEAEFTPRNVQTIESRKNTVFAIKLDLKPSDGKLKPGMPADVHFKANR
jgi:multidrug resistance efflux pump